LMAQKQAWECPRCLLRRPSQRLSSRVTSLWPVRTARCVRCVGRVLFGAVVNYESRGRLWVGTGEVGGRGYKKRREVKWANKAFREGTNGSLSRTSADGRRFHRCMHHGPWHRGPSDWARKVTHSGCRCDGANTIIGALSWACFVPRPGPSIARMSGLREACMCSSSVAAPIDPCRAGPPMALAASGCHLDHSPAAAQPRTVLI
jgi:hypothetical protein